MIRQIAGTLVVVHDRGILIRGPAGSGKSDAALALIQAGHQLVADDAVVIKQRNGQLFGSAPPMGRGLLYLRGPGLIRVDAVYGPAAMRDEAPLHQVIDLVDEPITDRIEGSHDFATIEGRRYPRLSIAPHRPIAALITTWAWRQLSECA